MIIETKKDIMGMKFPCIVTIIDIDEFIDYGVHNQYYSLGICKNAKEAINKLNDFIKYINGVPFGHYLFAKSAPINGIGWIGSSFYIE